MRLLSVNVSLPKEVEFKGKTIRTGIFKAPALGAVQVNSLNLDGDGQADLMGHGGEFRAVYVYSFDHYAFWSNELRRSDLGYGQFGENFTVEAMLDEDTRIGDQFRIGSALFEVTQPRVPCYKLAMKMNVEGFYTRILESGRLGFYFRVVEEGVVTAGDTITKEVSDTNGMTVSEANKLMYFDKDNLDAMRKAVGIKAFSPGWRTTFESRLAKAERSPSSQEPYRTFVIERKVKESDTITSFYLTREDNDALAPFLPGQFLPLRLDIPGQYKPVLRTYSLSDRPGENHYRLTIKREPAPPNQPDVYPGVSSTYFHDHLQVGSTVLAKSPRGKFFLAPDKESPVVLLSAGVGLTPMISMLNHIVDSGSKRPTWFIHGSRNGREHALSEHVRKLAAGNENIRTHVRYSQPSAEDLIGQHYDHAGHVDTELIREVLPDKDFDFYLCGPTPFMRSLLNGLLDWGVPSQRIHYEFFGPASALADRSRIAQPQAKAEISECCEDIEVTFVKSSVTTNWNPSFESLLDLAEAAGLSPDYSCRSGICHTCVCELRDGEVEYVQEPLDAPDEGNVLVCCAKPKTSVVLDL